MIVTNDRERWIGCTLCGEQVEVRERTFQIRETVLMMVEELREDHVECEKYKDDPRRAAIERGFKVRMRRENERQRPRLLGRRVA
jgi:hypothetical protein